MAEIMRFFDSTENDERIYTASDFADYLYSISGSGVSNDGNLSNLSVEAKTNMNIGLGSGRMFFNGYQYSNTDNLTLTHDTADVNNDRIDRVVIRYDFNPEKRSIHAVIKKGTPASSPKPPALTRDSYIHEMSVAQVRVIAGKSFIEQSEITDERANDDVCGYLLLHNIYRGLEINELGMVSMPEQSYIEMNNMQSKNIEGDSYQQGVNYIPTSIPIVPDVDRQEEVEDDGFFYPKQDGTYIFTLHVRITERLLYEGLGKFEGYLVINGDDNRRDAERLFNDYGPNTQFKGSSIIGLEKGDKVGIRVGLREVLEGKTLDYVRLTISKLN